MLISLSTVVASDINDTSISLNDVSTDVQSVNDNSDELSVDVQTQDTSSENIKNNTLLASSDDSDVLGDSPATFGALNNYIRTYSGSEIPLTQDATGTGSQISITNSNIVIDGQGNTLDASGRSRIFYITGNNVTLKNIKFVNGNYASGSGGAIYSTKSLNIINCTFENNYAGTAGGAIYATGNGFILNVYNSTFNNNYASYAAAISGQITNGYVNVYNGSFNYNSIGSSDMSLGGGVIYSQSSTVLYVNSSNFTGNEANTTEGGCIRHSGSATIENSIFDSNIARDGAAICSGNDAALVYINNNTFKNNFAYRWGGALQERNAIINNSKFINNTADLTSESSTEFGPYGGAIMVRNWIEIYNSEFLDNQARKGGAIYFEKRTDTATIQNCTFRNNSAVDYGGAITTELIGGTVTIKDSNFTENFAPAGGAIYMGTLKGAGTVRVSGSNFISNNATVSSGGAIYSGGGILNVANSNFIKNHAIDDGGAVYAKDADISFSNFTENNVADCGGAIYITSSLNIELSNLNKNDAIYGGAIYAPYIIASYITLTNNNATAGGAIYLDGTTSTANNIERSTFTNNNADDGGAIYVNVGGGSISNSNFISNYAGNDAGALFWNRGTGRVTRSTFRNNNASKDGGAIFWAADNGNIQSTFENNNATSRGGAIYWVGNSGTVITSTFNNNVAKKGLDVYWRGQSGALEESSFNGGAQTSDVVYWHGTSGSIIQNSFVNANVYICEHASVDLTQNTQTSSSSGYSIKNDGNITLSKNTFENPIYHNGVLQSTSTIEVLNNQSILTNNPAFDVYTVILDDNGNYIKLPDGVNNTYAGNTYVATFNNTHYIFNLPDVQLGVHVISVAGEYSSYLQSVTLKSGTLIYILLDVNVTIIDYGESVVINASVVNTTENGTGSIYINDQEYAVVFNNGTASLTLHNLAPNNYTITVVYEKYNQTVTTNASFNIELRKSNLTIITNNIAAGENNTIIINVTNGTTGTVYVFVNGEMYIRNLVNSTAQVNLTNVAGGVYNIYAIYTGDNYFDDCHGSAIFNATKVNPTFTINATDSLVGQYSVIKVTAPNDITGTVYVYVDNVEYSFDKQPISFTVSNLTAGTHNVRLQYAGDNKYLSGNATSAFKVNKKNMTMSITTKLIVVGQNETIEITVPSDATGIILIDVNGTKYYVYANNTKANLIIPNLRYGTYNVTATYVEDELYLEKSVKSIFKVDYADIDPVITYDVDSDLNVVVNVTVPTDATGDINIEVNGKNYTAYIIKGLASVSITDLEGGEYLAKMYFENDTKYKNTIKDFTIKLSKVNVRIYIDAPTIYVDENATITVTVASDAAGNVTIAINNKNYTTSVINGTAIFTVPELKAGNYEINAIYSGDRKYLSDDEERLLVVRKVDVSPYAYMSVNSIYVGEIATINITMPDDASGKVNLTIQDKLYVVNITNGRGQINISNLTYGVPVPIHASYGGDDKYLPCTRVNTEFAVHRISNYDVDIDATTNETAANITVSIPNDANGPGFITINNKTYDVEFVNGTTNITANNLTAGQKYEVYAYFGGDDKYTANDAVKTLNSDKSLDYVFDISVNDIVVGQTATVKIYLPNSTDGDNVTVKVAGKHDITLNIFNGTIEYPVYDLKAGSHAVVVTYHGNDKYESRSRYANISVSKITMFPLKIDYNTPYVNENVTFNITLPEGASGNITVRINNEDYPTVVINGSAQVITKGLPAGTYNATVLYSGNDKYQNRTQIVTVQVLKIKEYDFTMNVSDIFVDDNETIWVYLPNDINGTVTITINDTVHVDVVVEMKNGVGSINISGLTAGTYTAFATLSNDSKYDSHTIHGIFTVSTVDDYEFNVTYNTTVNVRDNITFVLELPSDANGYANITIFNKTYKVKVENGSATINNITAKEEGTFSFIASFEQEGKYNYKSKEGYVLVSKVDVELNPIYNATVNVDENVTVKFVLPVDATGNVSITSRGVTYSAELVNGSANVTMAGYSLASVYSPSISYTGDDKYNPASLSAKITVVKINDYELNITVANITVEQKEIVNITLPSDATDDVLISGNFSTETFSRLITNGTASITLSDLPAGTYNITVRYQGYAKYEEKSVTKTFTVSKVVPKIELEFVNNDTIIVKLPTNANGYANITVGDKIDTQIEIVNGIGSLNVSSLRPGDYFVNATFLGGVRYLSNNTNMTITIPKIKDYILPISVSDITVGENATIVITLPENATGNVNLTINDGEIITVPITNGSAVYNASNLKVDNYTVKVNYSNVEYELQSNSSDFKVNKIKTVIADVLTANATSLTVNVTLTEGVTGNVTIIIDGISHVIENIDSNELSLTVPIIPDEHDVIIIYSGDENHTDAAKTDYIEVFKITDYPILVEVTPVITVLENNIVTVSIPEGIEGIVHISVNGASYAPAKVNSTTGKATLTLPTLESGNYSVVASFSNDVYDYNMNSTNFTVIKLNTTINAVVQNITKDLSEIINITLNESTSGNVLIDINGLTYHTTVEKGFATLALSNLEEGDYTVVVTYLGDNHFNTNSTTAKFTVSKISLNITVNGTDVVVGKEVPLTIELSRNITTLVTVNIDDKNYTAILYEGKGSLSIPDLEIGQYNVTVYYLGDENYLAVNNTTTVNVNPKSKPSISVNVTNIIVGDDAIIRVVLNVTEGQVTLAMAGNPQTLPVVNGTVNFTVSNLSARNYHLTVTYLENDLYLSNSAVTDFVVYKKQSEIKINVTNIKVGDVETIKVNITENATGHVLIDIAGVQVYVNITDGTASAVFDDLGVNTYNVTVTYLGDENYNGTSANASFNVTKRDLGMVITAPDVTPVGHPVEFKIYTNESITEVIYIILGDNNYTTFVKDGAGNFTVYDLEVGSYNVTAEFPGNSKYDQISNSTKFNVSGKKATKLNVTVEDITVGENAVARVVVNASTGYVTLTIAGNVLTLPVVDGTVNFTLSNLSARNYHVSVFYFENDEYLASNATTEFTVNKKNSTISVEVANIHVGDVEVINVTVSEGASGIVLISVAGVHIYTEINGTTFAVEVPDLIVGNYTVVATYLGDDNYNGNSTEDAFNVTKLPIGIVIVGSDIVVGHPEVFTITMSEKITEVINITIGDKVYTTFIENGKGNFVVNDLAIGNYTAYVYFPGNSKYDAIGNSTDFEVYGKKQSEITIDIVNKSSVVGEDVIIFVNVTEGATGMVSIVVAGDVYSLTLNEGKANLTLSDLSARSYHVTAYYLGDENYLVSNASDNFEVNKIVTNITFDVKDINVGQIAVIIVKLNVETDENITVHVNGVKYILNNYETELEVENLPEGTVVVSAEYDGNYKYTRAFNETTFKVTKNTTSISVKPHDIEVGQTETIEIQLAHDINSVLEVKVGEISYAAIIKDGVAKLNVTNLAAGSYNVTVTFYGNNRYFNATANASFVVKRVSEFEMNADAIVNGSDVVIDVTLPDDANGDIYVVINNVNYTGTVVNGKGIIEISGLPGGEYGPVVYFNGDEKYFPASTLVEFAINKVKPYMNVSYDSISVGDDAVITVTLPADATGNVTLNINNKSYSDSVIEGVATFIIPDLAQGLYPFNVTYSGDGKYLSDDKFLELTVNKVFDHKLIINVENRSNIHVGDNATITVTLPVDATGNVSITVGNKTYNTGKLVNGTGFVVVECPERGSFVITAEYVGDDKYDYIKDNDHLDVRRYGNYPFDVSITNATIGENATITVTLPEDVTENVTITVGDDVYTVEVINGTANLTINVTEEGAIVVVDYPGDEKYESSSITTDLSGKKISNYDFTIEGDIIEYGETAYVKFHLPDDAYILTEGQNASVTVVVQGRQAITVYLKSADGYAIYTDLPVGNYSVSVTYNGNDKYASSTRHGELIVNKISNYDIGVEVNQPEVGENLTFIITLPEDAGGNLSVTIVTVEIGNKTYEVEVINGTANLSIPTDDFPDGDYDAIVYYSGDDHYDNMTKVVHVDIVKVKDYKFDLSVHNIFVGSNETITISLPEDVTETIRVLINGDEYLIDIVNGTGTRNITGLPHGVYDVEAIFDGNSKYAKSDKYDSFIVSKVSDYTFEMNYTENIKVGDNLTVEVTLPEDVKGNVTLVVDNKTFTAEIIDGVAVVNATGLTEGAYHFTLSFADENEKYASNSKVGVVVVTKTDVELNPVYENITVGENAIFEITSLPADATGNVTLLIDGKTYSQEIKEGKVVFNISDLDADIHTFIISYDGDNKYEGAIYTGTIKADKLSDYEWDFNVSDIKVGENEIINITLPSDANGDLIITVGNISYHKAVNGGETNYVISGLGEGTYEITVRYNGNHKYDGKSISKSFNVTKNDVEIAIEIIDRSVVVTLPEDASGEVTVTIGNKTETVPVENGKATIDIDDVTPGDYVVNVTYGGDEKYEATNASEPVNVPKVDDYDVIINVDNVTIGENATIEVILPDDATGFVNITVNNKTESVEIIDGKAILEVPTSAIGDYEVKVSYDGDEKYNNISETTAFHVKGKDLTPEVVIDENGTIIIRPLENATGSINVTVNNETITVPIENGSAIINNTIFEPGNHTIVVVYAGDDEYDPFNETVNVNVPKLDPTIELTVNNIVEGAVEVITIEVPSDATGIVLIDVDGTGYYKLIVDGKVTLDVSGLTEGSYDVEATYVGDSRYNNVSTTKSFTVHKVDVIPNISGNNSSIIVEIPENTTGGNVTVVIGNKNYTANITNGSADVNLSDLIPGQYNATVIYVDRDGNVTEFNTTITIPKWNATIDLEVIDILEGQTEVINITVPNSATGVILIDVDGVGYYVNVTDGKATFSVPNLKEGTYPVKVTYMGDDKYENVSTTDVFKVGPIDVPITPSINVTLPEDSKVGDVPVVNVTLPEDATGNVSVFVDGKKVAEVPVVNGTAAVPLEDLPAGDHVIEAKYSGDDNYAPASETCELSVDKVPANINVTADNINTGENATIAVDLPSDAEGIVLVDVDGKKYYAEIEDGKAVLNVSDLKAGNHTVKVTFPGDSKYANESATISFNVTKKSIATVIVVESKFTRIANDYDAGERGAKFYGVLMDTDGNVLANKIVQIAVNGPIYNVTTDDQGRAGLTVNLQNANTYTYALYFAGDELYNASHIASTKLTVTKKVTAISASGKSFKASAKTKTVSVTLKTTKNPYDGKTYLSAGKKITLKVNGKTYTAKTNSKGVAKFNVKLTKKGTFVTKISFAGDKTYQSSTKSIKIKIK